MVIALGDRHWRVRGLGKNLSYEQLRVNVMVRREGTDGARGSGFFVDTLELYSARQRGAFVKQASEELGVDERVVKRDLGRVLAELEALQDAAIRKKLEPEPEGYVMSDEERAEALALLRDPRLLDRIVTDLGETGIVGEEVNKLVGYLGVTSRKLDEPLAVVLQSSSAAGKSSLMEAVLGFVPEEERVLYSAMTGQSLFYMGETDLSHKVLAVAEEEGARSASYALKLLQSEGELTIASTGKDPSTGRLVTHEYRVKGPVMLFLTTTAIEVDEELQNRCLVLSVDEGRAQTRAIHERQRAGQTLEGQLARRARGRLRKLHQNAQRLIRPLVVVNPFASVLGFSDTRTRTRRDHMKYLTLIRTIALLHQHQRPVRVVEHRGRAGRVRGGDGRGREDREPAVSRSARAVARHALADDTRDSSRRCTRWSRRGRARQGVSRRGRALQSSRGARAHGSRAHAAQDPHGPARRARVPRRASWRPRPCDGVRARVPRRGRRWRALRARARRARRDRNASVRLEPVAPKRRVVGVRAREVAPKSPPSRPQVGGWSGC